MVPEHSPVRKLAQDPEYMGTYRIEKLMKKLMLYKNRVDVPLEQTYAEMLRTFYEEVLTVRKQQVIVLRNSLDFSFDINIIIGKQIPVSSSTKLIL